MGKERGMRFIVILMLLTSSWNNAISAEHDIAFDFRIELRYSPACMTCITERVLRAHI